MATRNRPGPRAVLFGLLLAFLLYGNPQVQGGECIGAKRAQAVRLFEILSYRMQKMFVNWTMSIQATVAEIPNKAIPLGIFLSKVQFSHESRETVHRLLTGEAYNPDKIALELKTLVEKTLSLSHPPIPGQEISPELQQKFRLETLTELRNAFTCAAGSFRTCQAVRQKKLQACKALDPLGQTLRQDCESLALRIGILYQGHCTEQEIGLMAETWGKNARAIQLYCQAIKDQRPESCAAIPEITPRENSWCRAIAGAGEKACDDSIMKPEDLRECIDNVRIRKALTGSIPLSGFPRLSPSAMSANLVLSALMASRDRRDCDQLALDIYDELTAAPNR